MYCVVIIRINHYEIIIRVPPVYQGQLLYGYLPVIKVIIFKVTIVFHLDVLISYGMLFMVGFKHLHTGHITIYIIRQLLSLTDYYSSNSALSIYHILMNLFAEFFFYWIIFVIIKIIFVRVNVNTFKLHQSTSSYNEVFN